MQSETISHIRNSRLASLLSPIVCWLISSLVLVLCISSLNHETLRWDEADYVMAARKGLMTNALDSTAFTAADLLHFFKSKFLKSPVTISETYDEVEDVFLLRHSHPPMISYVLNVLGRHRLVPGQEDDQLGVQMAGSIMLIAMMIWGYLSLNQWKADLPGILTTALLGLHCGFFLSKEIQCHLWIALTMIPTAIVYGWLLQNPGPSKALITGAWAGISFVALQSGLFVLFWILAGLSVLFFDPKFHQKFQDQANSKRKKLLSIIVIAILVLTGFSLSVLVLYPGAFLRLSLLRILGSYAYTIFKAGEYSSVTKNYTQIMYCVSPVILVTFWGILILGRKIFAHENRRFLACVIIGGGYAMALMKFLLNVTYIIPAASVLAVLGVASISAFKQTHIRWLCALITSILVTVTLYSNMNESQFEIASSDMQKLVSLINGQGVFAEGYGVLHFYCPEKKDQIHKLTFYKNGTLPMVRDRSTLNYRPLEREELAGNMMMVGVFNSSPPNAFEKSLPDEVQRIQIPGMKGRIYRFPKNYGQRENTKGEPMP